MIAWLYRQEGCGACDKARALLAGQGFEVRDVLIDNPLLEGAVAQLFSDGLVHSPVILIPGKGIYVMNAGASQFYRVATARPPAPVEA